MTRNTKNAHVAAVRELGDHAAVFVEEQGVDGQLQIAVGVQQCTGLAMPTSREVYTSLVFSASTMAITGGSSEKMVLYTAQV